MARRKMPQIVVLFLFGCASVLAICLFSQLPVLVGKAKVAQLRPEIAKLHTAKATVADTRLEMAKHGVKVRRMWKRGDKPFGSQAASPKGASEGWFFTVEHTEWELVCGAYWQCTLWFDEKGRLGTVTEDTQPMGCF